MAHPNWGEVAKGAFIRNCAAIQPTSSYLWAYSNDYHTLPSDFSTEFAGEKGVALRHYGPERIDAYVGAIFSNRMSIS